jgi:hypothetical protein
MRQVGRIETESLEETTNMRGTPSVEAEALRDGYPRHGLPLFLGWRACRLKLALGGYP